MKSRFGMYVVLFLTSGLINSTILDSWWPMAFFGAVSFCLLLVLAAESLVPPEEWDPSANDKRVTITDEELTQWIQDRGGLR